MFQQFYGVSLNSFASIFEVMLGVLIVFQGIDVAEKYIRKKIKLFRIKVGLTNNVYSNFLTRSFLFFESNDSIEVRYLAYKRRSFNKKLTSYLVYLVALEGGDRNAIILDSKNSNGYLSLILEKKMSPLFQLSSLLVFSILILVGLEDKDSKFFARYILQDRILIGSLDIYIFRILFFLNLQITFFSFLFFFRSYRGNRIFVPSLNAIILKYRGMGMNNLNEKIYRFLSMAFLIVKLFYSKYIRWLTFPKVLGTFIIVFSFSVYFAIDSNWEIKEPGARLIIITWSIFLSSFPFISMYFWATIGLEIKFERARRLLNINDAFIKNEELLLSPIHLVVKKSKAQDKLHFQYEKVTWKFHQIFLFVLRKYSTRLIGLVLIFAFTTYFFYSNFDLSGTEFERLITKAGNYEINSYEKISDKLDTTWFDVCYAKNAPIRRKIFSSLLAHKSKGESLVKSKLIPPHEINNISISSISGNLLKVEVDEYWYLRWQNSIKKPTSGYMTPSFYPQYYYLIKENKKWKIYDIQYFGVSF